MVKRLVQRLPPLYRAARVAHEHRRRRLDARSWSAPYLRAIEKIELLRETARRHDLRTLVETGTYEGETAWALRRDFDRIYTVELSDELFRLAGMRFARTPAVEVVHGDSSSALAPILAGLDAPALFWLDAHVSTTKSARGELPSPVVQELELVLADPPAHVVLVDDARLFTGRDDWPSLGDLEAIVHRLRPAYDVVVADDVVRILP